MATRKPKRPLPPSIMDPDFRYVPSNSTDIRKTFARIRREMAGKQQGATGSPPPVPEGTDKTLPAPIPIRRRRT